MRACLEALPPVARTGWNDACCRAADGDGDAFARWLVEAHGPSPALAGLDPSVAIGVAARRQAFDRLVRLAVAEIAGRGMAYEVWLLGVGFDARWDIVGAPPADAATRVLAFDLPAVLAARAQLLADTPLPVRRQPAIAIPVDFSRAIGALPGSDLPVIAIAEGLFDHLDATARAALLARLAAAAPGMVLLADGLDRRGAAFDNRRPERFTGDGGLRFVGAPADAVAFHRQCGWETRRQVPLFGEMAGLVAARRPALRWLRHLPLPGFARRLYALHWLEPAGRGAAHG